MVRQNSKHNINNIEQQQQQCNTFIYALKIWLDLMLSPLISIHTKTQNIYKNRYIARNARNSRRLKQKEGSPPVNDEYMNERLRNHRKNHRNSNFGVFKILYVLLLVSSVSDELCVCRSGER